MTLDDLNIATLHMTAKEATHTFRCSQFALREDDDMLVLASVIGPQTAVKSFMAVLNQNITAYFRVSADVEYKPRYTTYQAKKHAKQGNYTCRTHRLGFNIIQATAIFREPGFLPSVTEESIWTELTSPRYTTPLLRAWMPYMMRVLKNPLLVRCPAFQCEPGFLTATREQIDELVSRGLQTGEITIPRKGIT